MSLRVRAGVASLAAVPPSVEQRRWRRALSSSFLAGALALLLRVGPAGLPCHVVGESGCLVAGEGLGDVGRDRELPSKLLRGPGRCHRRDRYLGRSMLWSNGG